MRSRNWIKSRTAIAESCRRSVPTARDQEPGRRQAFNAARLTASGRIVGGPVRTECVALDDDILRAAKSISACCDRRQSERHAVLRGPGLDRLESSELRS